MEIKILKDYRTLGADDCKMMDKHNADMKYMLCHTSFGNPFVAAKSFSETFGKL